MRIAVIGACASSKTHPYQEKTMNKNLLSLALVATAAVTFFAGCASTPMMASYNQDAMPASVKVPAGHRVAMEAVGVGETAYECREKKDAAGQYEWVFLGPEAVLNDRCGKKIGSYFGPPATFENMDGSKVVGVQMAVSPSSPGNLPIQLAKANPTTGSGAMVGVTYVQRVNTKGGVAPATACGMATKGDLQKVKFQADYIFYKAG